MNEDSTRKLIIEILKQKFGDVFPPENRHVFPSNTTIWGGIDIAGVPWALLLAQESECEYIHIKDCHNIKSPVKGIPGKEYIEKKNIVVVENIIFAKESIKTTAPSIKNVRGKIHYYVNILDYGFPETESFLGEIDCKVISLIQFNDVLEMALKNEYINEKQLDIYKTWQKDPWNWGENNGFPKVEKKQNL